MSLGAFALGDEPLGGFGDLDSSDVVYLNVEEINFRLFINTLTLSQVHNLSVQHISLIMQAPEAYLDVMNPTKGPGKVAISVSGPSVSMSISP